MPDAIVVDQIKKSFGQKQALRGVSLTAQTGQIYGFLGPNGAGKTTTIRTIMDFIRPDSGNVSVFGQDARQHSTQVKRNIGYMAADNHLYPGWSAARQLGLSQRVWGELPLADSLLQRLQLDPKVPARHLSTGNHQKLGLVIAMAHQPKLLILDEPTRGLDPLLQHEIQTILTEFKERGGTVFISSHNLTEVEQLCDQVGIIKDGQMVANKSMADIRAMKAHLITFRLEKEAKIDIPNTQIVQQSGGQYVAKGQGDINPVVAALSKLKLLDLEITHLPLEEVFMGYYQDSTSGSADQENQS